MTSVGVVSDNAMGVALLTSKGSSDVIESMNEASQGYTGNGHCFGDVMDVWGMGVALVTSHAGW